MVDFSLLQDSEEAEFNASIPGQILTLLWVKRKWSNLWWIDSEKRLRALIERDTLNNWVDYAA